MKKVKESIYQINKVSSWLLCILQLGVLGMAIYAQSLFVIGCSILGLPLCLFRSKFIKLTEKKEILLKKSYKFVGLCLLPPCFGLCGLSVYQVIGSADKPAGFVEIVTICTLIAVQSVLLVCSLSENSKSKTAAMRAFRHIDYTLIAILATILISRLLWFGNADEWIQMISLTGCVLGSAVLLAGCSLLLCSLCECRTVIESIGFLKKMYHERRRYFHYASLGKDVIMVLAKVVMSIASHSFFMFANALFSCGIGLARYTALKINHKDTGMQLKVFRRVAAILSFSGLCYVGYSIRLFFGGKAGNYDMVMGLVIALYTFVEFGVQIDGMIRLRKDHDIEAEALRMIGLSSILISFVLTQTAIMSFSEPADHTFSNGLSGVVFGGLVVIVGITAWFRYLNRNCNL